VIVKHNDIQSVPYWSSGVTLSQWEGEVVWPFSGPAQTHSSQCSHHHSGHPHPGSSLPVVKAHLHQCLQPREGGVYVSVTLYSRVGKGIKAYMGHGKLKGSLGWKGSFFSTVKYSEIGEFCRNWGFAFETILGTYWLCTSSSRAQNFNFTMFRLIRIKIHK